MRIRLSIMLMCWRYLFLRPWIPLMYFSMGTNVDAVTVIQRCAEWFEIDDASASMSTLKHFFVNSIDSSEVKVSLSYRNSNIPYRCAFPGAYLYIVHISGEISSCASHGCFRISSMVNRNLGSPCRIPCNKSMHSFEQLSSLITQLKNSSSRSVTGGLS